MQPLPLSIPCNVYMSRSGYKAALWTCKQSYTQVSPSPSVLHELGINAADSDLYIINKVFLQHKILSLETILSASAPPPPPPHTHTGTRTHNHSGYTNLNIHSSKRAANARETWNGYRRTEQKTWQVYKFGKRNVFRLDLDESREGFSRRGRGRSFHVEGPKTKGAGTNSGESGARNLEAESIRSGAERTGGHVKWKTVTEIRRSSVRDIFIAESVYLVLNSLPDWKRVEKFKQVLCGQFHLCFFFFSSMRRAAQFCIRRRLWTEEAGRPERRELQ